MKGMVAEALESMLLLCKKTLNEDISKVDKQLFEYSKTYIEFLSSSTFIDMYAKTDISPKRKEVYNLLLNCLSTRQI